MGLDMYLMKTKKNKFFQAETIRRMANDLYYKTEENAVLFDVFEKLGLTYTYTEFEHLGEQTYLEKQVAYWRKANAIHSWIYENCAKEWQKDYDCITITKEHLEQLVDVCKQVLADLEICGKNKGARDIGFKNGKPIFEEFEEYNSKVAEELLPTKSGFFFGSTDYDDFYKQKLEDTIEQLEKALQETDFENEDLYYYASY